MKQIIIVITALGLLVFSVAATCNVPQLPEWWPPGPEVNEGHDPYDAPCDMTPSPGFTSCEEEVGFAQWLLDENGGAGSAPMPGTQGQPPPEGQEAGPILNSNGEQVGIFAGDDDLQCADVQFEPDKFVVYDCEGNLIREVPR
ncbi:MAG: hypothetical protein WD231_04865 [Candidatus Woykebacteria bacterium]